MNKLLLIPFALIINDISAQELITQEWNPKPMVEGNRRVDELMEWNRLHPGVMPPLTEEEKYELFVKKGLPVPGSGAQVRAIKSIRMDSERSASVNAYISEQKNKGYKEEFSADAKRLFDLPVIAEEDLEEHKLMALTDEDTHIRANAYELKMNYKYTLVPPNIVRTVIGFAPESSYMENGWNGVVEFFVPHFYGKVVCGFHEVNIALTRSSAVIPEEVATYKVNDKITTISAEGSDKSGYIYRIEWWDQTYRRTLECATEKYSNEIKNEFIGLAKVIDNKEQ